MKRVKLTEKTTGSKLLLDTLSELGVDTIFGYPGGAVLPLYDAIYDHKIQHILMRHEQGAVHAAEGYAKISGRPGVVLVTSGPGATNVVTGIADAMADSVPLIVFTGQVMQPFIGKDAFQEADMVGITMPITKYNYQIRETEDIPRIIHEAFHLAMTGRKGPIVIDLPKDRMVQEVNEINDPCVSLPSYQPHIEPNGLQLKRVINELEHSRKPLLLVGGGINGANAKAELIQFSEKYRIPAVSTLLGLGVMPNSHELFLGMAGMHGSFAANIALTQTDLLINIGSRFSDRVASAPDNFAPKAKVVHIDIDPAEIGKVINTHIPIVSDAKKALEGLLALDGVQPANEDWLKEVAQHKMRHPFHYNRKQLEEIKPQRVIELIGEITAGEAIVVTDVGQHQMWTAQFYPFKHANQLVTSGGLGTMGFGIPAAIGAKMANTDKEVVLFVGDGGFQMTNQELALLTVYRLPIKVILMNNHSLGMVRQWQESFFNERRSESVFAIQPDFQKLAEAYHLEHFHFTKNETLADDLKKSLQAGRPTFIEVEISATEHVLPMVPVGKANDQMIGVSENS